MVVELVCVGTEILLGNIVNTNAAYLAEQCAALGLSCYYQSVVGDNPERLAALLETAKARADIVLVCGGLGPTQDDLTKETAARVMGKQLEQDPATAERIARYFEERGMTPTENNWKQAMIPEGAQILENDNGTAPGILLEEQGNVLILLPGPPGEMIPMFEKSVRPYLAGLTRETIYSQTVRLCGIAESRAEDMIADLIDAQDNPTIATYAKTGEVHLRVTAKAADEKSAYGMVKPVVRELRERFGSAVYTTAEGVTLEQSVAALLRERKLTVSVAESCTGGLLSARLVNVPGISEAYRAGFVTYSNKAKRKLLGVNKKTLEKYGAVSEQTAKEMAAGAAKTAKADVAVAITGIAGPGGGTEEKPVGLVYIGCSVCGIVQAERCRFQGSRAKIRENAAAAALAFMRYCILEYGRKDDGASSGGKKQTGKER